MAELELGSGETTEEQVAAEPAPAEEPAKEPIPVEPEPEPPAAEEPPVGEPKPEPQPDVTVPTVTDDRDYKAEAEAERARADAVEQQLGELSEKFLRQSISVPPPLPIVEQPGEAPPAAVPAAPTPPTPPTPDVLPFVNEEQHTRMLETPAGANAVYNAMYQRFVQDSMRASVAIAQRAAKMEVYQERLNTQFYDANKDLKPYAGYVQTLITEIAAGKPGLNVPARWPELLTEAAKQARAKLPHLQKAEETTPAPAPVVTPNPTTVTKPPTSRQPVAQIDGLAKEIADLADLKDI